MGKNVLHLILFVLGITTLVGQQKKGTNNCPDFKKAKETRDSKKPLLETTGGAKIIRGSNTIKFNVVKLSDKKLEIPAFKQFKNNMTDFTSDGEEEFKKIVVKIHDYLGPNTNGEGVTLEVIGSASQIPTSFDPSKPNNNINPDGSSILGATTIENNKLLALARASELGKKIKAVFPEIELEISKLDGIQLGKTTWDENAQKRLNVAVEKKDKKAIEAIFAPYQKEQFVMVRTKEYKTEFIQPEALRSCYVNISPPIQHTDKNGSKFTIGHFVVSEATFHKLGGNKEFVSTEERDNYIKTALRASVHRAVYSSQEHWFLLTTKEALSLRPPEDYKKVKELHKNHIFDLKDRAILEDMIVRELLKTVQ
jgi:hypothetical protein